MRSARWVVGLASVMGLVSCGAPPAPSAQPGPAVASAAASPVAVTVAPSVAAVTPSPSGGRAAGGVLAIPIRKPQNVPKDIPQQMTFFMSPFVGGFEGCPDVATAPADAGAPAKEVRLSAGQIEWCYCKLAEPLDQRVTATLSLDSRPIASISSTVKEAATGDRCIRFLYGFTHYPARQPHAFSVRLAGRAVVEQFVPVIGEYRFTGFQPNEPVRIVIYASLDDQGEPVFIADVRVQADAEGLLRVDAADLPGSPLRRVIVYGVGKTTACRMFDSDFFPDQPSSLCIGMADDKSDDPILGWTYDSPGPIMTYWAACPNAPRSQLHSGDTVDVQATQDSLPVYAQAGAGGKVVGSLPTGTSVDIVDGPQCADGRVWWRIRSAETGVEGWSIEGEDEYDVYLRVWR